MSIDESTVLEALLSSEIMHVAVFADDDRPMTLARSLGIPEGRLRA